MRRLWLLAIVALVSVACGSATEAVHVAATTVAPSTTATPTTVPETTIASTTVAPAAAVDVEVSLLSGRDAIAANSGKAHVLWFWGAH